MAPYFLCGFFLFCFVLFPSESWSHSVASPAAADGAREEQSGEIPAEFVYNQDAASPEGALGTKQEAQE